jgi:hypothetical protein
LAEQFKQETEEFPAQLTKKRRSREEKIGRLKYNQYLLKRVLTEITVVREMQRIILNGLKGAGYFRFDMPLLQKYACEDQVDMEILQIVFQVGRDGILPKDVAADLPEYHLRHYQVTRRIQRMNKRLEHETGERLFEKRGWKWALTSFAFEIWGDEKRFELRSIDVKT